MPKKLIAAIATSLSLIATSASAEEVFVQVNDQFGQYNFEWASGNDGMLIRYYPIVHDGELHICGAFAGKSARARGNRFHRAALQEAKITLHGERLLQDLRFFSQSSRAYMRENLVGQTATCKTTGRAATSIDYAGISMEFRQGSYRVRR